MKPVGYYVARAWQYEADVLSGAIAACKWVRLACDRNRRDRARAEAGEGLFVFDVEAAERVCRAAEALPHVKGPKAKLVRDATGDGWHWQTIELEPWQCWFTCLVFGWLRREDRLRRFTRFLLLVPRKNGKSVLLAVYCLYMLTADGESGADVYSAATKHDQARVVFDMAATMARRTPAFMQYFGVVPYETQLKVPTTASQFSPLSADDKTLDGLNPSFAAVDELHAHRTRGVWDVLVTAQSSRDQPLLGAITTAGTNLGGICYEVWTYAQKVLEGTVEDDSFCAVNYTIDEADLPYWDTEPVLRKANPNWGISVNPRTTLADAALARRSPGAINNFLTKQANIWVRAASPWMPMNAWAACAVSNLTWESFLEADRVVLTVDLAEVRDIASIVAIGRWPDGTVRAKARHFYPEDAIAESPIAQMSGWVHEGWLVAVPGQTQDFGLIERELAGPGDDEPDLEVTGPGLFERLRAIRIGFDRALALHLMQRLQKRLGEDAVTEVRQNTATFNPAMKALIGWVQARTFQHDGDPVLAWMVSNVAEKKTHLEESFPVKASGKDSPEKIDGAVALLMGASELLAAVETPESVYVW